MANAANEAALFGEARSSPPTASSSAHTPADLSAGLVVTAHTVAEARRELSLNPAPLEESKGC